MARLRTIHEAYAHLKAQDPDTGVTLHFLRGLAVRGDIPSVRAGRKYLIDIDGLAELLAGRLPNRAPEPQEGGIRAVPERRRF